MTDPTPVENTPVENVTDTPAQGYPADEPSSNAVEVPTNKKEANFKLNYSYYSEMMTKFHQFQVPIPFASASRKQTSEKMVNVPNLKSDSPEMMKYVSTIVNATRTLFQNDAFGDVAHRDDSMFEQTLDINGKKLGALIPKFNLTNSRTPTGESVINLVRNKLQLGTMFLVPLYHSGFWVLLKTPASSAVLTLHEKIVSEKANIGRSVEGLPFSNSMSFTIASIMDFIEDNLYESSFAIPPDKKLRDYVLVNDIPSLVWGMAAAIYPHGFIYERACITDVEKCTHHVKAVLDMSKVFWVDTTKLTEAQKVHMTSTRRGSMTLEQVQAYQNAFSMNSGVQKIVEDGPTDTPTLAVELKNPTIAAHLDAGYRWISQTEEAYGNSLKLDVDKREAFLLKILNSQALRTYSHYVSAVIVEDNRIVEQDDLDNILNTVSEEPLISSKILEAVSEYRQNSTIAFIAIPTYICPSCGGDQISKDQNSKIPPELIPIDPIQTFFQLMIQKVRMLVNEE